MSHGNPFLWNGTEIKLTAHRHINTVHRIKYWEITCDQWSVKCHAKMVKNILPCVYDEIKEFFYLPKIGTHWSRINRNLYILYRLPLDDDNNPIYEYSLDRIPLTILQSIHFEQIRHLLLFRELMGILTRGVRTLRCRIEPPLDPYFLSYDEPNISSDIELSVLSDDIKKRFFPYHPLSDYINDFLHISHDNDISDMLYNFRYFLEKVIDRVQRRLIWMVLFTCERFQKIVTDSG